MLLSELVLCDLLDGAVKIGSQILMFFPISVKDSLRGVKSETSESLFESGTSLSSTHV